MPDTPEREIERQLRQHAEARRAAAGEPSLHPATRRLLQAEVRRQWGGRTAGREEEGWWRRFGPRLAFALGMVALVGVAAALLFDFGGAPSGNLARLENNSRSAVPLAAPSGPAEGEPLFHQAPAAEYGRTIAGGALAGGAAPAPAPRAFSAADTLAARETAPVAEGQFFGAATLALRDDFQHWKGSPKPEAVGSDRSAKVAAVSPAAPGITQAFRNAALPAGAVAGVVQLPPVLNNFTVAQAGETLTVVDEDGSVYRGNVTPLPEPTAEAASTLAAADARRAGGGEARALAASAPLNPAARPAARAEAGGEAFQNWQFQVEGTNLSLRQRVVFQGNLYQNAPAALLNNAVNFQRQANAPTDANAPGRVATQNQLNSFIQGRVQVGGQRETELNAIPVEP